MCNNLVILRGEVQTKPIRDYFNNSLYRFSVLFTDAMKNEGSVWVLISDGQMKFVEGLDSGNNVMVYGTLKYNEFSDGELLRKEISVLAQHIHKILDK